jgi:hypothetical protein
MAPADGCFGAGSGRICCKSEAGQELLDALPKLRDLTEHCSLDDRGARRDAWIMLKGTQ